MTELVKIDVTMAQKDFWLRKAASLQKAGDVPSSPSWGMQ